MIFSINFFNRSVVLIAAILIFLSGCSKVNGPTVKGVNGSFTNDKNLPIAVLPVNNLSGIPAPTNDIRESFLNNLRREGLNTLDDKVLERFITRHRIRYLGGIDSATAEAFRKETGAKSLLITSLELYSEAFPPKIALTSRLVSTDVTTSILWMKGIGLAGDDSPGILGLGLIENPKVLSEAAILNLTDSLARFLVGHKEGIDIPKKRKKFQPKVAFQSPVIAPNIKYRIAVLPFFNLSERKYAGEIMALIFLSQLETYGNFDTIEPGVVRRYLLDLRVVMDDGLSFAQASAMFSKLDADLILTGKVMDYQDYEGFTGKSKVDFSALLIERKSLEVVWSSKSYNEGDDGVFFFDLGKVNTAHAMASEMAENVLEMISEENP